MIKTRWAVKACSLALCLCLAGCSTAPDIPQPTLDELLAEVNAEHQKIETPHIDRASYLRDAPDKATVEKYRLEDVQDCDLNAEITAARAAEDVEYLFGAFQALYGPYTYLGGDEVFNAHKADILARCTEQDSWTVQDFRDMMAEELAFLPDAHFNLHNRRTQPSQVPFFFRQTAFYKTGTGYQTAAGQTVQSVDGYPELDKLMKRSISPEGELVYYPVLLQPRDLSTEEQICDETLTVRYTDGSSEHLAAEPFRFYGLYGYEKGDPELPVTDLHETRGIPVAALNACNTNSMDEILRSASALKNAPIAILDLSQNFGGNSLAGDQWLQEYCGQQVPNNMVSFRVFGSRVSAPSRDKWVANDNILIVLTGKLTASAAEDLVDKAYNLENVLFIGENTGGYLLTSASNEIQLPNSHLRIVMGDSLLCLTASREEGGHEFEGYYPDIWVPADEAEELAAKLIERLL